LAITSSHDIGVSTGPSLRIRRLGSGNEKRPVIKSKRIFFKRAMFYLYFLKDKYKVPYICGTPIGGKDYRIHEEPPPNTKSKRKVEKTTVYMRNPHLTPKARGTNFNKPKRLKQEDRK
jgi:hypothetical protein